jgi:tungstate transport system ATP-binding protein
MLSVRHLEHRYANRLVLAVEAAALEPGKVTGLVGPNGSGKSTLLRLMSFVERPTRGQITLDGHPVETASERRRARRLVTLVEQQPLLFDMTVAENLAYGLRLAGRRAAAEPQPLRQALERVGAGDLADRRARTLSVGQVQRVAIARALLLVPRVLLLDEPASAGDHAARSALGEVLAYLDAQGITTCLASHQLEDAYRWSSGILALAEGRLTPVTPENLFRVDLPPGSGSRRVRAGPLELTVVTDRVGPATLAIPPDDIVVSAAPLHSSVRNEFPGRVVKISDDGRGHVRLTADVGVELVARITPAALAELGISIGSPVVFSIKAMAVRVF